MKVVGTYAGERTRNPKATREEIASEKNSEQQSVANSGTTDNSMNSLGKVRAANFKKVKDNLMLI